MHIVFVRALTWVWSRATPKGHTVSGGITTPALVVVVTHSCTRLGVTGGRLADPAACVRVCMRARARVWVCVARVPVRVTT